ncbi:MAG: hypothetical protein SAJ37_21390 [Oscillatoria sp. PMC 1068.18]|nr:hypothetical protein [Oscillatoria sp. PMC 1068.18]
MLHKKLVLEISESLLQELEQLSKLTEEPIESLAVQILASRVYYRLEKERRLFERLEKINPENVHDEINFEESVDSEN